MRTPRLFHPLHPLHQKENNLLGLILTSHTSSAGWLKKTNTHTHTTNPPAMNTGDQQTPVNPRVQRILLQIGLF